MFTAQVVVYSPWFERVRWEHSFKHFWTAYVAVRLMAKYIDKFVVPKHYGWQEVWGRTGYFWEYDHTPLPIGISWRIMENDHDRRREEAQVRS
jgi:hypothetical protein